MTTPKENIITHSALQVLEEAKVLAESGGDRYLTPEHILYVLNGKEPFRKCLQENGYDADMIDMAILSFLAYFPTERKDAGKVQLSRPLVWAIGNAINEADEKGQQPVGIQHLIYGISEVEESLAGYLLREKGHSLSNLITATANQYK